MKDFTKKRIIILTHVFTTVPADDLKLFLLNHQPNKLLFIGHPLSFRPGRPGPSYEAYEKGRLIRKNQKRNIKLPNIVQYIKDVVLSMYWIAKNGRKWDLIIALDNLNAMVGLLLRFFGIVDRMIYYTIDFTPQRFSNRIMNDLYHGIDKLCVAKSDLTWNISPRIAQGRQQMRNMSIQKYNRQITVPVGVWLERIHVGNYTDIEPHSLVYAGGLSKHQGIQLVLESIPEIIRYFADFKFYIIGVGDYESALKEMVVRLRIGDHVRFLGYFEKHEDVEKRLVRCGLAAAMYNEEFAQWSYYADPSKIKSYLAAGLPVITTPLTYFAEHVTGENCGIVIEYDKEQLASAVIRVFTDSALQQRLRKNAIRFARSFNWNDIFTNALQTIE